MLVARTGPQRAASAPLRPGHPGLDCQERQAPREQAAAMPCAGSDGAAAPQAQEQIAGNSVKAAVGEGDSALVMVLKTALRLFQAQDSAALPPS